MAAAVLGVLAVVAAVLAYGAVSPDYGSGPDIIDWLPIVSLSAGPWLIAAIVAWAGGTITDALVVEDPVPPASLEP